MFPLGVEEEDMIVCQIAERAMTYHQKFLIGRCGSKRG